MTDDAARRRSPRADLRLGPGPGPGSTPERTALASPVDVLLASADDVVRGRMAGVLRRSAHTVVEAESAAEAVEAVRQGCAPRLLLLDLEGASPAERSAPSPPSARSPLARARPSSSSPGSGNDEAPGLSPDGQPPEARRRSRTGRGGAAIVRYARGVKATPHRSALAAALLLAGLAPARRGGGAANGPVLAFHGRRQDLAGLPDGVASSDPGAGPLLIDEIGGRVHPAPARRGTHRCTAAGSWAPTWPTPGTCSRSASARWASPAR